MSQYTQRQLFFYVLGYSWDPRAIMSHRQPTNRRVTSDAPRPRDDGRAVDGRWSTRSRTRCGGEHLRLGAFARVLDALALLTLHELAVSSK